MAIPFQLKDEEEIEFFLIPVNRNVAPSVGLKSYPPQRRNDIVGK
jgi:hypothetical protein